MSNVQDGKVLPEVQIVCAVAQDGAFGYRNPNEYASQMPWGHIREDMLHFQRLTREGLVMMGTNTYWSLPEKFRPLPGRHNVVIGKNNVPAPSKHVSIFSNINNALDVCHKDFPDKTIYLIGGKQLINSFLSSENDFAKYVTEIHQTIILCDIAVNEAGVVKDKNTFVFFDEMLHPDRVYTDFFLSSSMIMHDAGISITNYVARREV
jgi:dihydrofolate reductase